MTHKNFMPKTMSVAELRARRAFLSKRIPGAEELLRGSLQHQYRRCGRVGCRCSQGEPHGPYVYLAVRTPGRRGMIYVPAEAVQAVERRIEVTGRIEDALAEISAINIELLARGELD